MINKNTRSSLSKLSPLTATVLVEVKIVTIVIATTVLFSCSQNVDKISITENNPAPVVVPPVVPVPSHFSQPFFNVDLNGTSTLIPQSASFSLGIHSLGETGLRTQSSSANFKMISGVGIE